MNSFADSVHRFVAAVQQNTVQIPAPLEGLKQWPVVGPHLYYTWSKAHADFPALVQSIQPKTVDLARQAQSIVASVGGSMLLFLISFVVANVIMAYGDSAERSGRAIFSSVAGSSRGESLAKLSIATLSRKGSSVSPLFRRCLSD